MGKTVIYIASLLTLSWGVLHLVFTSGVVENFGELSTGNRMIVTMEWIVEGVALIFIGVLTIIVTITDTESQLAKRIYLTIVGMLFSLAVVSLFTGFRVDFIPYKICPVIFSLSAILIIVGMNLKPNQK